MRLPVSYLALGPGALDLAPVRARTRLQGAQVVVGDEVARLGSWAPDAERIEARGREPAEIVALLKAAHLAGRDAVRALSGSLAESIRALDEIRILLEADVTLELIGAAPGDGIRWPYRSRLPLAGKRIGLTRPRAADDALSDRLARLGAELLETPALEKSDPADFGPLDRAIDGLHRYTHLVLTSATGVEALIARLFVRGKDARWLTGLRLGVVGPGTAAALRGHGLVADLAPAEYRGEALAQAIADDGGSSARVLLVRAAEGREALPVELSKAGILVDVVAAYQMRPPPPATFALLKERLAAGALDLLVFASAAAARSVVAAVGREALVSVPIAALGPVTAEGVRALGLEPRIIPPSARFDELAEAIAAHFAIPRDDR
jgi:uroporphyrinogen III methyltransferase/synthase